ncbi:MAG: histidine phosphatase family protein [Ardenticatenaceae bacterium]|nr:histidine phosphatase family protein [Ardenticatenaceae bacterium]
MKTLLIMRHAKSSWDNRHLADYDRPLNPRGERDAPRMGELLRKEGLIPDVIVTSSAERALKTAELVALSCDFSSSLVTDRELYHAPAETYFDVISKLDPELKTALVVGHNPGIEMFLSKVVLTWTTMTTANIGHVQLDIPDWSHFQEGVSGRLIHFWQPKALFK